MILTLELFMEIKVTAILKINVNLWLIRMPKAELSNTRKNPRLFIYNRFLSKLFEKFLSPLRLGIYVKSVCVFLPSMPRTFLDDFTFFLYNVLFHGIIDFWDCHQFLLFLFQMKQYHQSFIVRYFVPIKYCILFPYT